MEIAAESGLGTTWSGNLMVAHRPLATPAVLALRIIEPVWIIALVDVLRDPSAEEAFGVFLSRFSHLTYLSAVVILELRAGARTPGQAKLLEQEVVERFARANRVFTPSSDAFSAAGKLLATLANREGWTADAHPSLVHDALLAASCRESGITLITRDRDFTRFKTVLRGRRFVAPWPEVSQQR